MELKKKTALKPKLPIPMKEEGKISKEAVLYIYRPEVKIVCKECSFVKGSKCALFGSSVTISRETGTCGFYIHGHENPAQPWVSNVTKEEAGYAENKTGFQCKRCEEWLPEELGCKKVDRYSTGDTPGIIAANACCNRWEPDKVRAMLDSIKLDEFVAKHAKKETKT